jgi:hypothetical protein
MIILPIFAAAVILVMFMYSVWMAINPIALLKTAGFIAALPMFLIAFVIEFFLTLPFWAFVKFLSTLHEGGII